MNTLAGGSDGRLIIKQSIEESKITKALGRHLSWDESSLLKKISELTGLYEMFAAEIENSPEAITALLNKLELARLRWSASSKDELEYVFRIREVLNPKIESKLYMENKEFLFTVG